MLSVSEFRGSAVLVHVEESFLSALDAAAGGRCEASRLWKPFGNRRSRHPTERALLSRE